MTLVTRVKCDGCNREVAWPFGFKGAPPGWFIVQGEWDPDHECAAELHACSLDCLIFWANEERRERTNYFARAHSLDLERVAS